MKVLRLTFVLILYSIVCVQAQQHAPNQSWRWVNFDERDGIAHGSIYGVFEAKNGTLWVANDAGVAWYDNYKWNQINIFRNNPFPYTFTKFEEDSKGNLYALCNDTIYAISKTVYKKLLFSLGNEILQVRDFVFSGPNDELLLCTRGQNPRDNRLYKKDSKGLHTLWVNQAPGNNAPVQLLKSNRGTIFFNKGNALFEISSTNTLIPVGIHSENNLLFLGLNPSPGNTFYTYLRSDNRDRGFYSLQRKGPGFMVTRESLQVDELCLSYFVKDDNTAVALLQNGQVYLKQNNIWNELTLPANLSNLKFAFITRDNNIWFGTTTSMLCYHTRTDVWRYYATGSSFESGMVSEIFIDDKGNRWLGLGEGVGLLKPDGSYRHITEINGKRLPQITGISQDDMGRIWISSGSSSQSTYFFDGSTWHQVGKKEGFTDYPVHRILKQSGGELWFLVFINKVSTRVLGDGVYQLKKGTFSKLDFHPEINSQRIYDVHVAKNKATYFATSNALYRLQNNKLKTWDMVNGKAITRSFDMEEASDGCIYSIAFSHGLLCIKGDSIFQLPSPKGFNFRQDVSSLLLAPDNTLWISSNNGLWAYKEGLFYQLSLDEGLNNPVVWPVKYHNGELYIGTIGNGLAVFNPSKMPAKKPLVHVNISNISGDQALLNWRAYPYNKYLNNDRFEISYRVDTQEWSAYSKSSPVSISNLSPGLHSISVKVKNQFVRQYDEPDLTTQIQIPYPFYLQWYYVIPLAALSAGVVVLLYVYMTERNRSFKMSKHNEQKLNSLINSMPFASYLLNTDGTCIESYTSHLMPLPPSLHLSQGDHLSKILSAHQTEDVLVSIRDCIQKNNLEFYEFEHMASGRYFEVRFTPFINEDGDKWVTSVLIDITDKKKNEAELIKARHDAENADKAKMIFLTNMSHEIRTPMNAIVGIADLMLDENLQEEQKENLKIIKRSADNLIVVINDILDFSKIEAGKIEFEVIEFELRDLVDQVVRTFQFRAEQKKIELHVSFDHYIPRVLIGDPYRLTQVLVNLVGNSIKFTSNGKVEINISKVSQDDKFVKIRFEVADTGIGISTDKLEKIFESFTQENKEVTRKYGGTGLGLTITKRLVELQKGTIDVKSTLGVGTEFTVELDYEYTTNEKIFKNDLRTNKELKGLKVLLVEDNYMNQVVARQFLQRWQAEVDTANNGVEALDKLRQKLYDLVLMDIQMPELDGYETTHIIRNREADVLNPNVPIIALTADAFPEVRKKALACGMDDFISKPFKQDELFIKIAKHAYQID